MEILKKEFNILFGIKHANIVLLLGYISTEGNGDGEDREVANPTSGNSNESRSRKVVKTRKLCFKLNTCVTFDMKKGLS